VNLGTRDLGNASRRDHQHVSATGSSYAPDARARAACIARMGVGPSIRATPRERLSRSGARVSPSLLVLSVSGNEEFGGARCYVSPSPPQCSRCRTISAVWIATSSLDLALPVAERSRRGGSRRRPMLAFISHRPRASYPSRCMWQPLCGPRPPDAHDWPGSERSGCSARRRSQTQCLLNTGAFHPFEAPRPPLVLADPPG